MGDTTKLLKLVRSLPEEEAREYLVGYINKLAESLIENAWNKARKLLRFNNSRKRKRLKQHILELDDVSLSITILDFSRFFFAVIDDAIELMKENDCPETRKLVEDLEDMMYMRTGAVRMDRRILARKDD